MFVEWVKGQHVADGQSRLVGQRLGDAQGAAGIKDVTFVFRGEREVRTAMARTGEADIARWITVDQCKTTPNCQETPSLETIFVRDGPGAPDAEGHPGPPGHRVEHRQGRRHQRPDGRRYGRTAAVGPASLGYNPNLEPYPYDVAKAKQLIAAAKADGVPLICR